MGSQRVRYDWAHVQNLLQHKNKRQFPFCWKVKTHQGTISITTQSNITLNYMNMISHNWMLKLSNSLFSFSIYLLSTSYIYFPAGSEGKESACNAGDPGSISGLERSSGEGNGNPLQYSCLENPMDGGAWRATAPWGRKESDTTEHLHFHFHTHADLLLKNYSEWYTEEKEAMGENSLGRTNLIWMEGSSGRVIFLLKFER